jgi:hypothetical protein
VSRSRDSGQEAARPRSRHPPVGGKVGTGCFHTVFPLHSLALGREGFFDAFGIYFDKKNLLTRFDC